MRFVVKLTVVSFLTACSNGSIAVTVAGGNELEQCISWFHYMHSNGNTWSYKADAADNFDGNCNGVVDEADMDSDGWTTGEGDCDDALASIHPDAVDTCNGVDDDCNGAIDDGDECSLVICALDRDGDNLGDCSVTIQAGACYSGYVGGWDQTANRSLGFMVEITEDEANCDDDDFDNALN